MKISLKIRVNGNFWNGGASMEIPELYMQCFEPLKINDDVLMAYAEGGVMEKDARIVMKTRENAAEILGRALAEMIVTEMKKNDTLNGYPTEDKDHKISK